MKVLLCTKSFPPVVGGSSFLLYELLRHWAKNSLYVIHGINDPPITGTHNLPFWRKQIKVFYNNKVTLKVQNRWPQIFLILIKRKIRQTIKQQKITHIYAHYPNAAFVVAAYLVAKEKSLPLTIYYDILWDQGNDTPDSRLAKKYEKLIVNYAINRFAITEFALSHLENKHKLSFDLIPHTANLEFIKNSSNSEKEASIPKFHFAGGIYDNMNKDSLLRIYQAICALFDDFELELCTNEIPSEFKGDKRVKQRYYTHEELILSQQSSDLLLLPQAFNSKVPEMIKNNFPTKTMEYVCSGTPILVHSPEDSYLTYVAKKHHFGLLIEEENISRLKEGILLILKNNSLKEELTKNAISFAKQRDSVYWSKYLLERIKSNH